MSLQSDVPTRRARPAPPGALPTLQGASVVVLGASSGLGRAAALAFAQAGANLTLAARGSEGLEAAAAACRALGVAVVAQAVDATDAAAVRALAEVAQAEHGRIDVWVNNLGLGAVGAFDETPIEAHDQIIRANLLGHMHGAHAVLPIFKAQGAGVLIHVNSAGGWTPAPYAAAYSASKFGLRAYAEALRGELAEHRGIHVCDVYPTFLDTPGLSHGANYAGRRLRPAPPVMAPERVAAVLTSLALRPRKSVILGLPAHAARLGYALAPGMTVSLMGRFMRSYFKLAEPAGRTDGALFSPSAAPGSVTGGLKRPNMRAAAAAAGAGLAVFAGLSLLQGAVRRARR
jgi:short-subunit dehydrogenase